MREQVNPASKTNNYLPTAKTNSFLPLPRKKH
jgi:hypothetical protein